MTMKQRLWIPAGIVLLALAVTQAHLPLSAEGPSRNADKSAKPKMQCQCPMMASMKGMQTFADSPGVLLSQAKDLGLTDKQKKRIEEILQSARKQARAVLTADQQAKLKDSPQGPLSMMDLCMMRMKKMMGQKKQQGMMCPCCLKMMQKKLQSKGKEHGKKHKGKHRKKKEKHSEKQP
jgi:hypothetical protein